MSTFLRLLVELIGGQFVRWADEDDPKILTKALGLAPNYQALNPLPDLAYGLSGLIETVEKLTDEDFARLRDSGRILLNVAKTATDFKAARDLMSLAK